MATGLRQQLVDATSAHNVAANEKPQELPPCAQIRYLQHEMTARSYTQAPPSLAQHAFIRNPNGLRQKSDPPRQASSANVR